MAGPNPQLVQMAFAGGIDESQRAEVLDPTTGFLVLENVRQHSRGAVTKRRGFEAQTLARLDGTNRSAGRKLLTDGTTQCVIDGGKLDAYSSNLPVNTTRDRVPEVSQRVFSVPRGGSGPRTVDVEYCNGYLAILSVTPDGFYATIVHEATNAVVLAPTLVRAGLPTTQWAITSFSDRYFVVFSSFDGSSNVYADICDTNSAAGFSAGFASLATVTTTEGVWAACSLEERVAIACTDGTDITVKTYNASGLVQSATVTAATVNALCIAGSNADVLWVGWADGQDCKVIGLTGNSLSTVIATTATIITATLAVLFMHVAPKGGSQDAKLVVADTSTDIQMHHRAFTVSGGAATASGSQTTIFNAQPTGRPFSYGGRYYGPIVANAYGNLGFNPGEGSLVLCDLTESTTYLRPIANCYPQMAGGAATSKVVSNGSKHYFAVSMLQSRLVDDASYSFAPIGTGSAVVEWDFGSPIRWQPAAHGGTTFLSGGLLSYFDGARVLEAGFIQRPQVPIAVSGGTGITLTNGRRYVVVYEDVDADGNRTVGPVSTPSTIGGAITNKTMNVSTTTATISSRLANGSVHAAFYATLDANNGSPPYYRLGSTIVNTGFPLVSFADDTPDVSLATASKLYAPNLPGAVGESLERRAPTGFMHIISYNGSLVGAADSTLFQSGQQVLGEATWFSPLLQYPVPGDNEITGLATQDGTLYVFKRREVYAVAGESPSDNGTSGGLGTPRRLAVDVGCIDARSICTTALGVFFQSERGIELLSRAQSVEWIGEQVQDTVDAFPVCTAATLNPFDNTVMFEFAEAETANQVSGAGRTLVYDLSLKVWCSTDRRKNSAGTADTPAQSAAIIYTGTAYRYAWLGTDGRVYVEDEESCLDGSYWVTMRAKTGWFKMGGIQGQQALNTAILLAKKSTDHNVSMALAYDYAASAKTPRTWVHSEIVSHVAGWPSEQLEHQVHVDAEGQSMQIEISDATPTGGTVGAGTGATWIALTIEGMPKNGAARLPSTAR